MSYEIPSSWIPFIQIGGFVGVIATIIVYAVKITKHITRKEGEFRNEVTRLEGRINVLEERINNVRTDVQRQENTISNLNNYLLNNAKNLLGINPNKGD